MNDRELRKNINILEHINDYCVNIEEIHKRFGNDIKVFMDDIVYEQAIAFNVMQIGELVAKLSDDFRKETKNIIPWAAIKGMRNVVVHSYGHIDKEILWDSSMDGISALKEFCIWRIKEFDDRKTEKSEIPTDSSVETMNHKEFVQQRLQNPWQRKGR